jgi:hypothetical protein
MPTELKRVGTGDLPALVNLLNRSSEGCSFAFHLDLVKYLNLSGFWNFSYELSYLAWADAQPAGVLLNCVDREQQEAHSYYWGVLPDFRKRRLSLDLVHTYLGELKRQGFRNAYATSSADSPLDIYLKLGFREHHRLLELRTAQLPSSSSSHRVSKLDAATLLSELQSFPYSDRPWVARPAFLQTAAPFLDLFGVWEDGTLAGWMALTRWTGETSIVAFEFLPGRDVAARDMLSYLAVYAAPYSATHIVAGSRADMLLRSAGFEAAVERISVVLDLDTYLPKRRR